MRTRAWTAIALPPLAWFGFQQGVSALLRADCTRTGWGLAWGAASLVACLAAARIAWALARLGEVSADTWLARLSLAVAGVFALAIMFQIVAILLVPACVG